MEALSIQGDDTIRHSATTYIYDAKTRKINTNQFFSYAIDKASYTVGDRVTMQFYTDVADPHSLFLFQTIGTAKGKTQVLEWKDGQATYSFVLTRDMVSPTIAFSPYSSVTIRSHMRLSTYRSSVPTRIY